MRFHVLKSIGHNLGDSLASGICLMIGVYSTDVFAEAAAGVEGYIEVDFLRGTTSGSSASRQLRRAVSRYKEELPKFCLRHGVNVEAFRALQVRFGLDPQYGRHFTVTVESTAGKRSTAHYVGVPGRRLQRRGSAFPMYAA